MLPSELWSIVIEFTPLEQRPAIRLVCRLFSHIAAVPLLLGSPDAVERAFESGPRAMQVLLEGIPRIASVELPSCDVVVDNWPAALAMTRIETLCHRLFLSLRGRLRHVESVVLGSTAPHLALNVLHASGCHRIQSIGVVVVRQEELRAMRQVRWPGSLRQVDLMFEDIDDFVEAGPSLDRVLQNLSAHCPAIEELMLRLPWDAANSGCLRHMFNRLKFPRLQRLELPCEAEEAGLVTEDLASAMERFPALGALDTSGHMKSTFAAFGHMVDLDISWTRCAEDGLLALAESPSLCRLTVVGCSGMTDAVMGAMAAGSTGANLTVLYTGGGALTPAVFRALARFTALETLGMFWSDMNMLDVIDERDAVAMFEAIGPKLVRLKLYFITLTDFSLLPLSVHCCNLQTLELVGTYTCPLDDPECRWDELIINLLPGLARVVLTGAYAQPGVTQFADALGDTLVRTVAESQPSGAPLPVIELCEP